MGNRTVLGLLLFCMLMLAPLAGHGQAPSSRREAIKLESSPINWDTANDALTDELNSADIGSLARRVLNEPQPQKAAAWLRRLALLVRAEYRKDAFDMLRSRPRYMSPQVDWKLNELEEEERGHDDFEMARRICEQFPEERYGYIDWILRDLSPAAADAWLTDRGSGADREFIAARLNWRGREHTEAELLAPYEKHVREHPDSTDALDDYWWAVAAAGQAPSISLLADVCTPKLASRSFQLGCAVQRAGGDATRLFERALNTPFTAPDSHYLGAYYQSTEVQFRAQTKEALLVAYQKSGRTAKALALQEELYPKSSSKVPNPNDAAQAAEVLRAAEREAETAARAADDAPENRNSEAYWRDRATFHEVRKEDDAALAAFKNALSASPLPTDNLPSYRLDTVRMYAEFLAYKGPSHPKESITLLLHELSLAPIDSSYADGIVAQILQYENDDVHMIDPNSQRFWSYLEAKPDWQPHSKLLDRLAHNAPANEREAIWQRAETLAKAAPAGRAYTLADTMMSCDESARSIGWWQKAAEISSDPAQRPNARNILWRIYNAGNDWLEMEKLLPALTHDGPDGFNKATNLMTSRLIDLAIAAAKSGAKAKAMIFFRQWSNQDRRNAPAFYPIPYLGLSEDMKAYYRKMAIDEPRCATPRRVLGHGGLKTYYQNAPTSLLQAPSNSKP